MSKRPTPEEKARHEAAWDAYQSFQELEAPLLKKMMGENASLAALMHEQFLIACFLEDSLLELGASESYRQKANEELLNLCMRLPSWAAFDKIYSDSEQYLNAQQSNKAPITQTVPPPTKLLSTWWETAKLSRGDSGVYPQVFLVKAYDDVISFYALVLEGNAAITVAIDTIRKNNPEEFVLGIDMRAKPNQDIEFNDFLAVVWYFEGEFYTGVVDYQLSTATPPEGETEPAFRPIRWDNQVWNHTLRERHPIPAMREALKAANANIGEA